MSAPITPPAAPWRAILRPLADVLAEDPPAVAAPGSAGWRVPPPWEIRVAGHPPTYNDRLHPLARYRISRPFKDAAAWQARALVLDLRLPAPLRALHVQATLCYRRRPFRDADNATSCLKPLLDGLVAGGLLADDGPDHLTLAPVRHELGTERAVVLRIAPVCPDE